MQKLWISAPSFLLPRGQSNNWRRLLLQYVDWIHLVYPGQARLRYHQRRTWSLAMLLNGALKSFHTDTYCPSVSDFACIWHLPYTRNATDISDQDWLHAGLTLCVLLLSFVLYYEEKIKFDIDAMPSPSPTH